MKKAVISVICALAALCLFACGAGDRTASVKPPEQIDVAALLNEVCAEFGLTAGERYCSEKADGAYFFDDDILAGTYGDLVSDFPEVESMIKYCAFFSSEPYGPEFGVFIFNDGSDAEDMRKFVDDRMAALKRNARNYPSVDTSLIDGEYGAVYGQIYIYSALGDADKKFETIFRAAAEEN